jgi:hypothetical protein
MVFADPNTGHSLAKMMWLLLIYRVVKDGVLPREVPAVTNLLWLMKLGDAARDIAAASLNKGSSEVFSAGPSKFAAHDLLLHRALPLCAYLASDKGQAGASPGLLALSKQSELTREYLLRFALMQIQADKDERLAQELLKASFPFAAHPGFRRGLAWVLQKTANPQSPMLQVRKAAIENVLLPHLLELQATAGDEDADVRELVGAHESLSAVLASDQQLQPELLTAYLKDALRSVPHGLYLSGMFNKARAAYEKVLARGTLVGLRALLGLPVLPANAPKDMSPGSFKMSPSPGPSRPQSSSPSPPRSTGAQSASPSYSSPGNTIML